jgi:tetratricopeptide (TPR) repeat protein
LPETVLGMVEARLSALQTESRRVLRLASIFGEIFWTNAVQSLLGNEGFTSVNAALTELVRLEVLTHRKERRFSGEDEYAFRHALVREGAYAMLTERDRQAGHALAGDWLERAGELDAAALAEHFERGGERRRAAVWHAKAAMRALPGNDMQAVLTAVERGLSAEPDTETATLLWAIRTQAAHISNDHELSLQAAEETMQRATPGSFWHCRALGLGLISAAVQRRYDLLPIYMGRLLTVEPVPHDIAAIAGMFMNAIYVLLLGAQREAALLYLNRLRALAAKSQGYEPAITGAVAFASANWARDVERDSWAALALTAEAERHFTAAGEPHIAINALAAQAVNSHDLGAFDEALVFVDRLLARARPGSTPAILSALPRSAVLLELGAIDEALEVARCLIEQPDTSAYVSVGHFIRAEAGLLRGDLDACEAAIDAAATAMTGFGNLDRGWSGIKAKLLLARGRARDAVDMVSEAIGRDRQAGVFNARHREHLLIRAEALMAAGDEDAARAAIREAQDDLLQCARKITDPTYRKSFLERISWNARIVQLARQWLGAEPSAADAL